MLLYRDRGAHGATSTSRDRKYLQEEEGGGGERANEQAPFSLLNLMSLIAKPISITA